MKDNASAAQRDKNNLPYIEPTIRVIAGFVLSIIGVALYFYRDSSVVLIAALLFVSLNLFQSGISGFCIMEKTLKFFCFRSELDEIKTLSLEAERTASIQKNHMKTLNLLSEAIVELSLEGIIFSASDGWLKLISNSQLDENADAASLLAYVHEDDKSRVLDKLKEVSQLDEKVLRVRFRFKHNENKQHWIGGKFMLEKLDSSDIRIRGVLRDITDAYLQEKQIEHMAMHDALTNLPNRTLLDEKMKQALAQAKRNQTLLGLLFIDLDNFKQVNDVHGHKAGDQLLVSVSKIMQQRLRETDTLARWGGDEFVIVLPELKKISDVRAIAESLMKMLEIELAREGFEDVVTLSIGAAVYPDDADTAESLLVQADKALYLAKEQGRNNAQVYAELRDTHDGYYGFDMSNRFSQAIKENKLQVHYQVIVSTADEKPTGFEVLARWHDEKYGWVSPATFIPMAENMGLIHEVGRQVLKQALDDFAPVAENSDLVLSINISNRQLMQGDFNAWINEMIEGYPIRPPQIKLEITESLAQISVNKAKEILESLRVTGFKLSLDDFGTGYSSLSHLHNLPVDELKIDMSFVRRFNNKDGRIMLETIVAMGHALYLEVVAEGIESEKCMQVMNELGVDKLQGYYFSKPLPWSEVKPIYFFVPAENVS